MVNSNAGYFLMLYVVKLGTMNRGAEMPTFLQWVELSIKLVGKKLHLCLRAPYDVPVEEESEFIALEKGVRLQSSQCCITYVILGNNSCTSAAVRQLNFFLLAAPGKGRDTLVCTRGQNQSCDSCWHPALGFIAI